jgi:hypothetical protein
MAVPTHDVSSAVKEGIAAGVGGGIVTATLGLLGAWRVSVRRQIKVHTRIEALETQIAKDQKFRRVVVESQMTQIDLFQLIIDRTSATCADCPAIEHKARDERAQDIIDKARDELRKYLGGIA